MHLVRDFDEKWEYKIMYYPITSEKYILVEVLCNIGSQFTRKFLILSLLFNFKKLGHRHKLNKALHNLVDFHQNEGY